jgi:hypothetical protein
MSNAQLPLLRFVLANYRHFNARATRDALLAHFRHVRCGGEAVGLLCQVSDSTTSYGSCSGATPNEKITWDELTPETPMFVIESDATIVVPLMLAALLECQAQPEEAEAIIGG